MQDKNENKRKFQKNNSFIDFGNNNMFMYGKKV